MRNFSFTRGQLARRSVAAPKWPHHLPQHPREAVRRQEESQHCSVRCNVATEGKSCEVLTHSPQVLLIWYAVWPSNPKSVSELLP